MDVTTGCSYGVRVCVATCPHDDLVCLYSFRCSLYPALAVHDNVKHTCRAMCIHCVYLACSVVLHLSIVNYN